MDSDATDVSALEGDPTQMHADSLARYFVTMRDIAVDLDRLARAEVPPTCRLAADERTAREAGGSLMLTQYIQERAATAARFLFELHRSTLEVDPGQLTLDFVLLYPTMRAAVENSAALTWLLSPADRPERLERLIRVLRRDVGQFVANNKRLAASRNDSMPIPAEMFDQLATAMETQGPLATNYLDSAASAIGLDVRATQGQLQTATPIAGVYGDNSLVHVVWRFLSDLTHFSYSIMKNQEIAEAEGGGPVRIASLQLFTTTTTLTARDALQALQHATRPESHP
ncbi:hypothetical protein SAMN04487846_3573 [Microbacterium sp. cf046]|uniref:hypothetical protein n=1 Tax=Microbacterium sp. cf046 TaxID=1761803 RepID=UPI0008DFCE56|nr:hypothetical protein [Microbacterium sp. cf046]SFS17490.1 hypothetical protein SAMN04487846_3573 [Microbacterium sp. cf046]